MIIKTMGEKNVYSYLRKYQVGQFDQFGVEFPSQLINITDSLLDPKHQQCTIRIIFSNNAGHSDPLIHTII